MLALAFRPRMGSAAFQRPAGVGTTVHLSHAHFSVLCWLKRKRQVKALLLELFLSFLFFFLSVKNILEICWQ